MKKKYETPKAEKFLFDYESSLVASPGSESSDAKDGRSPSHPSYNACFTHNTSDVSEHNMTPCDGDPK